MSRIASYLLPPPVLPDPPPMDGFDESVRDQLRDGAIELLPPGRAFSRRLDSLIAEALTALVTEQARVKARARAVLASISPALTSDPESLAAWEEAAGTPSTGTPAARAERAAAAIRGQVRRSWARFVEVALSEGVALSPPHASSAFRAGTSRAGDAVYSDAWAFYLVMPGTGTGSQRAAAQARLEALARAHVLVRVVAP